jgi:hypothetical protein
MKARLEVVSDLGHLPAEKALDAGRRVLFGRGVSLRSFQLYGKPVDLAQPTSKILKVAGTPHFLLEGGGWSLRLGSIARFAIDLFTIEADFTLISPKQWVQEIRARTEIIQAWVVNAEYDFWQNAQDPLQYTANGRSYDHLPMRSNGLPPPLEQDIIDVSQNPGRRVLRIGYVEAVGSPMWFGPGFWRLTGADKQRVRSAEWTNCTEAEDGLVYIQPSDEPFASNEGESERIQSQLRQLLYPGGGVYGRA